MNPLSLITILTGAIFLLAGFLLHTFPPQKINWLYGYRTNTSMRNQETWLAANRFASKMMMQTGLLLMVVGGLTFLLPPAPITGMLAGIALVMLTAFLQFYFTEKYLKKHFDEHGNRRN